VITERTTDKGFVDESENQSLDCSLSLIPLSFRGRTCHNASHIDVIRPVRKKSFLRRPFAPLPYAFIGWFSPKMPL